MNIDLFTVLAEVFNFLVLMFLLQRFLYRPIVNMMDAREQAIIGRIAQAEQQYQEAAEEKGLYEEKVRVFEQERLRLMDEAREQSKVYHQQLVDDTHTEIEVLRQQWQEIVVLEREAFLQDLRIDLGAEIVNTARAILKNMANETLEHQVVGVFITRIEALSHDDKQKLIKAVSDRDDVLYIQSAFALSDDARVQLERTLKPFCDAGQLRYEIDQNLLCGVRIATPEYEIAWSFDHYIDILQQQFRQTLADNLKEITHEQGETQYASTHS